MNDGDTRWLTYAELSTALGISPASARRLAARKKKWPRQSNNAGLTTVGVPSDYLEREAPVRPVVSPDIPPDDRNDDRDDDRDDARDDVRAVIGALERQIGRLEADLASARTAADRLAVVEQEVAALRAIADAERARAAELKTERDEALRIALSRRSWWPFRRSA